MIILIGSQKGGCGKSTIAINIAAYLAKHNKDIVLVDADPQQSSANWVKDRDDTDLPESALCSTLWRHQEHTERPR